MEEARSKGFGWAATYARENTSSPIIGKQGFQTVGAMRYWERDFTTQESLSD